MTKPSAGTVFEGRVRDLAHGGDAVVETERGIVMARGALPGERVRIQATGKARGVARGRLLAVIEASPERVTAPCPVVERCGGCPLMTWSAAAQTAWKRARLTRVLEQVGAAVTPEWIAGPTLHYRARARLAWRARGNNAELGYHAAASREVVDVAECYVLREELARGLARLRETLAPRLTGSGEIALGLGEQERCVAELTSDAPQPPAVYAALEALVATGELAGLTLRVGRDGARALFGDPRQLIAANDGKPLWAAPGGFVQANSFVNAALVARVRTLAEARDARVLELYAGHGNFTLALAAEAAQLTAVETDREAADACRTNLAARGFVNAHVVCADAAQGARGTGRIDVVVLDPPRTGAKDVLPALIERRPARVVYVSCELSTLRRDLTELLAAGYTLDAAAGFDMFPQTPHLESVVRLSAQGRARGAS